MKQSYPITSHALGAGQLMTAATMNSIAHRLIQAGTLIVLSFLLAFTGPLRAEEPAPLGLDMIKSWTGDFDAMEKRRIVRILVPYSKTIYFIDKGQELGTAVDIGRAFQKVLNKDKKKATEQVHVVFVPMPRARLLAALNEGLGDLAAGSLTITSERRDLVDFSQPFTSNVKEVLVTGPAAPALARIEDLAGRPLYVRKSSSYYEHLTALDARLKAPIGLIAAEEALEDEDLLEMVSAGLLPYAIVDDYKAQIWAKVLPHLTVRSDLAVNEGGEIAWAMRKNSPQLKAEVDAFVAKHKLGTTFGNILKKRYYTSDKMARRALSTEAQKRFEEFSEAFEKYGDEFGFEHFLIAAQGYQESELDQGRRSPRGAVGVMQLLPSTAADKSIGVKDIVGSADRNIYAGTKYLRYLITTYIDDEGIDDLNRVLFAFAAYNAGPGNLKKFRAKAKSMGLDANLWFGNVENGAAAIVGRETVQYVSNIYKYYIAYTLAARIEANRDAAVSRTETQKQ